MIRLSLLLFYVFGLAVYALRDWYVALCGLIALMAVIEHPDMPKTLLGVQGLNPWNLLLLVVVTGLARQPPARTPDLGHAAQRQPPPAGLPRRRAGGLPAHVGGSRTAARSPLRISSANTWSTRSSGSMPGLLLFDGCRTRRRFLLGLAQRS